MNLFDSAVMTVSQTRYDELVRKEAMLDNIKLLHGKTTGYAFHDVVGYLFNSEVEFKPKTVNADE
jgi:hypothetical protein